MTVGLAAAAANNILNVYRNVTYTQLVVWVKLHTNVGDPGAAGTSNPSAVLTRNQATWNAASGGSMTINTLAAWTMTTTETIAHISMWDASTAGNFLQSASLTTPQAVVNTNTLTLTTLTLSYTPIAA